MGFFWVKLLYLFYVSTECSTEVLRNVNAIFGILNTYIIYKINIKLNLEKDTTAIILKSIVTSIFPVLFFFNFLYYTDPGSLFFVLLTYYLSLKQQFNYAGLVFKYYPYK